MDISKINDFMNILQNEIQYINAKVINEKDQKIKSKMLKQVVLINQLSSKIFEFKTNGSHYRDK
jgi:hypothetical protein